MASISTKEENGEEMIDLTDLVKAYDMLKESKNAGLSTGEAVIMISYIVKDLLIVGGILGTIIWFRKTRNIGNTDEK